MNIIEKIKNQVEIKSLLDALGIKTNIKKYLYEGDHYSDSWVYSSQKNIVSNFNEARTDRAYGNPFDFYIRYTGSSEKDAVEFFKKNFNIFEDSDNTFTPTIQKVELKPIAQIPEINDDMKISLFLSGRGIDFSLLPKGLVTLVHTRVYGKDAPIGETDCIQVPMYHELSLCGYQIRSIEGKGFFTNGSDGLFYSFDKTVNNDYIILVEGLTDFLSIRQFTCQVIGLKSSKTPLTEKMYSFLSKFKKIYICMDQDNAGRAARQKLLESIDSDIYVFEELAEGEDMNDFVKDLGKEAIDSMMQYSVLTKEKVFSHISYSEGLSRGYKELTERTRESVMSWGFEKFDEHLGFILPGQLIVVGGVTGSGKSTFVNQIANNVASQGFKVARYSLEDRMEENRINDLYYEVIRLRKARGDTVFPPHHIFEANMVTEQDYPNITYDIQIAMKNLRNFNANIIDLSNKKMVGIQELEALFNDVVVNEKVSLVVIDHLHYVKFEKNARHDLAIEDFMHALNDLLRRYKVSCILVSHYRKLKDDEAPTNDDFKDGAAISQVANKIIHLDKLRDQLDGKALDKIEGSEETDRRIRYVVTKNRGKSWLGAIHGQFVNGRIMMGESKLKKERREEKIRGYVATPKNIEGIF